MSSFGDLNRVNTHIQSLDSQFSLNRINRDLADNQLRLSTGLRINRAEDDAAVYSIATKLNSSVTGLEQALSNVDIAKSVLDIAESSFDIVIDSLIEMKSLATQAANDTLGEDERGYIADQTVFQGTDLLSGTDNTGSLTLTFQVGERVDNTLEAELDAVNVGELFASDATGATVNFGADTAGGGGMADGEAITATAASGGTPGGLNYNNAETADFRQFIGAVDDAIGEMNNRVNDIGMAQSSLSTREVTLSQSISANSSASSRIMDTDFAKDQSESVRLQILQQTSTSALAQANMGPQSVLGLLE